MVYIDWQLIVIIAVGGTSLLLVFVYLTLFALHWHNLRKEFKVKRIYNQVAVLPLHNSRVILERLAENGDQFKGGASFITAADLRLRETLKQVRDQITALEKANMEGDYGNAARIADQIEPSLIALRASVENLTEQINAPSDFINTFDNILVEYRRQYETAVSAYEGKLISDSTSSKIVEGRKFVCSSLLESIDAEKFQMDAARQAEVIGRLHEAVRMFCMVVYKPPKLRFLTNSYVPARIASLERAALDAQAAGVIADFEWINDIVKEIKVRQTKVQELLQDLEVEEAEEILKEIIKMLDLAQYTIQSEQNALDLLGHAGKTASEVIERAVRTRHILVELLTTTSKEVNLSPEARNAFQNVINQSARLAGMHEETASRAVESVAFSSLSEELQTLSRMLLNLKESLKKVLKILATHEDLHAHLSVEAANLRLMLHDLQYLLEQEQSDVLSARFEASILSQQSELEQIETNISSGSADAETVRQRLAYAKKITHSLLVQINAFKAEANIAERLIVYVSKYRNEAPDIANALLNAENRFAQGDYASSLKVLLPAVDNIKRSAAQNKVKLS